MKNIIILLLILHNLILCTLITAQSPDKMSYQAIVRNSNGNLVQNGSISIKIGILQYSTNGEAVFTETHSATTNNNGLISIEIGSGIPETGNFKSIKWSDGPFFIKTEIDITGGNNFNIISISQILSVPYALYARNADSSAKYKETDPMFLLHPSSGITTTNIANWSTAYGWGNHTGLYRPVSYVPDWSEILSNPFELNSPSTGQLLKFNGSKWINFSPEFITKEGDSSVTNEIQDLVLISNKLKITNNASATEIDLATYKDDGSETKINAGTNITISGIGTQADPYVINASGSSANHYIGESYGGGIVFFVYDNGQHGLIAATADQSGGVQWFNGTFRFTGTSGTGIGAGEMNTTMIISNLIRDNETGSFAARLCANYSVTASGITYGDWYLPSKDELLLLYQNKGVVGGFNTGGYWSSTETSSLSASFVLFSNGSASTLDKDGGNSVRAIRAF